MGLTLKVAYSFSPASISSFFAPYIVNDPLRCGAIGGGVPLNVGVKVAVKLEESNCGLLLKSRINGKSFDSFIVKKVLELLGINRDLNYIIEVDQFIDVPIGCGYGTSGASALAVTMALCKALNINMTFMSMARIAHLVDYYCGTGLGTVSGIFGCVGGIRLIVSPGGPGYAVVDRIFIPRDCYIVSAAFGPIDKRDILRDSSRLSYIESLGKMTLNDILRNPSIDNFFNCCRNFASKAGFMSPHLKNLFMDLEKAEFYLFTQNMIGDALHILVYPEDLDKVKNILLKYFSVDSIITARVEDRGPRYLDRL
ncbi:MAG: hypothetical protein QXO74_02350 [Candidatus Methanomethylicia archaeon]